MAEAAQCTVHIAALVAESLSRDVTVNALKIGMSLPPDNPTSLPLYLLSPVSTSRSLVLLTLNNRVGLPSGSAAFKLITPNVADECIRASVQVITTVRSVGGGGWTSGWASGRVGGVTNE